MDNLKRVESSAEDVSAVDGAAWARGARGRGLALACVHGDEKPGAVAAAAEIRANSEKIRAANQLDFAAAKARGAAGSSLDRLLLDAGRIEAMARGLEEIAALPDPVAACWRASSARTGS